ncbi:MAG: hypothetical protein HN350_19780 [Phycisphaerales bacterium]|jgi:hypothetical protein|nr:hypothetical protein [Phycisphaerales bacterium]
MVRRRLSALSTVFYKIVFPAIWFVGLGMGTVAAFAIDLSLPHGAALLGGVRWLLLAVWLVGSSLLIWFGSMLRTVWLDDECLIVRNFLAEVTIPLSAVRHVRETTRTRNQKNGSINLPKMIVLEIDATGHLPDRVRFVAPFAFQTEFEPHPLVIELLDLSDQTAQQTKQTRPNNYPPPAPDSDIRW